MHQIEVFRTYAGDIAIGIDDKPLIRVQDHSPSLERLAVTVNDIIKGLVPTRAVDSFSVWMTDVGWKLTVQRVPEEASDAENQDGD